MHMCLSIYVCVCVCVCVCVGACASTCACAQTGFCVDVREAYALTCVAIMLISFAVWCSLYSLVLNCLFDSNEILNAMWV